MTTTKMRKPKTRKQIEKILARIAFMDRKIRLLDKGDGYLLQLEYYEPDLDIPGSAPVVQRTRKWYISPWMTETEIVETAFAACLRSMQHITKENFTYNGLRVYSPHIDIKVRCRVARAGKFDRRPN